MTILLSLSVKLPYITFNSVYGLLQRTINVLVNISLLHSCGNLSLTTISHVTTQVDPNGTENVLYTDFKFTLNVTPSHSIDGVTDKIES